MCKDVSSEDPSAKAGQCFCRRIREPPGANGVWRLRENQVTCITAMRRYLLAFLISPISGPLALRGVECLYAGRRLLGLTYFVAIPLLWIDMVLLATRGL